MTSPHAASIVRIAGIGGALCGASGVLLGAFGAHALRGHLGDDALALWRTAVDYQFWHALALLIVAARVTSANARILCVAALGFLCGVLLFSGSLFALALGAPRGVGVVTPFGGAAFAAGWFALLVSFLHARTESSTR